MTYKTLAQVERLSLDDINKMTLKQVRQVARVYSGVVRKRVERLEKSGIPSAAITRLKRQLNGKLDWKLEGSTKQQLMKKLVVYRQFMSGKTSTVTGARDFLREAQERFGPDVNLSEEGWILSDVLDIFLRLKEETPRASNDYGSTRLIKEIQEVQRADVDDPLETAREMVELGLTFEQWQEATANDTLWELPEDYENEDSWFTVRDI